ncbi:IQ calmodulin-binding protein, putative [Bodo saltans]|uniref:IQ calmodulin-binding protein, putative n=1 Tax=Bodo saltans TaxID=75058 RepID=A0A0S4J9A9_BODSA|nr:IQ calmodulin-binding protein, putative [Bodo saltans]|eukprot:CUG85456.1 IQ calmodulin-binding protein, putative [Bodo saltans]
MSDFRRSSVYSTQPTQQHRRSLAGSLGGHRNSRSRSQSAVRDNVQDIRRHVTTVAQNSQALAEKFTEQLRKYKSFAPIFASGGVYAQDSPTTSQQAMHSIDQILDTRASFLVRNMTHHRIVQSSIPQQVADPRTRLAALDSALEGIIGSLNAAGGPMAPHPPADAAGPDDAFLVWLQENPNASHEERNAEQRRRHAEKVDAERASRAKYLRKWHAELELALAEDAANSAPLQSDQLEAETVVAPRPPPRKPPAHEVELQTIAWNVFQNGLTAINKNARRLSLQAVTGDPEEAEALHHWVEGEWIGHTHRHEAAALCIQCAFRCYRSKKAVHRARYLRQQMHMEQLKSEEEAMYAWKVAVEVMSDEANGRHQDGANGDGQIDKTLEVIHFFMERMTAKGLRRRAAKNESASRRFEDESFAAQRIQSVYRGHRGRVLVKELRNPEIRKRRTAVLQNGAATVIQSVWRRYATKKRLRLMKCSSVTIQCCIRRHFACKRLAALRRASREAGNHALMMFAASRISSFLRRSIAIRRRRYSNNIQQIALIHRFASGLRARVSLRRCQAVGDSCGAALPSADVATTTTFRRLRSFIGLPLDFELVCPSDAAKLLGQLPSFVELMTGYATRRGVCSSRQLVMKEAHQARVSELRLKSVASIQRIVRGFLGRRRARQLRRLAAEDDAAAQQHDAATVVQSWYRGVQVRSRPTSANVSAAPVSDNENDNSSSAHQLEGIHVQEEQQVGSGVHMEVPNADVELPAGTQQLHDDVREDAAKIIQDFYLNRIRLRKVANTIKRAGAVVYRFMRRAAAQRIVERKRSEPPRVANRDNAATSIQLAVRAYQARALIAQLKSKREAVYLFVQQNEAAHVVTRFMRHLATRRKTEAKKLQQSNSEEGRE